MLHIVKERLSRKCMQISKRICVIVLWGPFRWLQKIFVIFIEDILCGWTVWASFKKQLIATVWYITVEDLSWWFEKVGKLKSTDFVVKTFGLCANSDSGFGLICNHSTISLESMYHRKFESKNILFSVLYLQTLASCFIITQWGYESENELPWKFIDECNHCAFSCKSPSEMEGEKVFLVKKVFGAESICPVSHLQKINSRWKCLLSFI